MCMQVCTAGLSPTAHPAAIAVAVLGPVQASQVAPPRLEVPMPAALVSWTCAVSIVQVRSTRYSCAAAAVSAMRTTMDMQHEESRWLTCRCVLPRTAPSGRPRTRPLLPPPRHQQLQAGRLIEFSDSVWERSIGNVAMQVFWPAHLHCREQVPMRRRLEGLAVAPTQLPDRLAALHMKVCFACFHRQNVWR